mmetsp:Transcript_10913/g.30621  ORF Transcript_10913/g.30621 Transcript_10913/m.30621 type:complete len:428 (+) Transcript_10913:812-2095(+)
MLVVSGVAIAVFELGTGRPAGGTRGVRPLRSGPHSLRGLLEGGVGSSLHGVLRLGRDAGLVIVLAILGNWRHAGQGRLGGNIVHPLRQLRPHASTRRVRGIRPAEGRGVLGGGLGRRYRRGGRGGGGGHGRPGEGQDVAGLAHLDLVHLGEDGVVLDALVEGGVLLQLFEGHEEIVLPAGVLLQELVVLILLIGKCSGQSLLQLEVDGIKGRAGRRRAARRRWTADGRGRALPLLLLGPPPTALLLLLLEHLLLLVEAGGLDPRHLLGDGVVEVRLAGVLVDGLLPDGALGLVGRRRGTGTAALALPLLLLLGHVQSLVVVVRLVPLGLLGEGVVVVRLAGRFVDDGPPPVDPGLLLLLLLGVGGRGGRPGLVDGAGAGAEGLDGGGHPPLLLVGHGGRGALDGHLPVGTPDDLDVGRGGGGGGGGR